MILTESDITSKLGELENWRSETIEKLRKKEKTSCEGCPMLQPGFYAKKPTVTSLAVGPKFSGTRCNCSCIYCIQSASLGLKDEQKLTGYDIHRIASEYYDGINFIILAEGEPSIMPQIDDLFEIVEEKKWSVQFNTNAITYSERVAQVLGKQKNSLVTVSLDCGTPETYRKVKRVNQFKRVVDNLRAYSENGCMINLKFILLPGYNDNFEDIDSFINIAKELKNLSRVVISQDMLAKSNEGHMPESVFIWFSYFVARLQEEGIRWSLTKEFITDYDYRRIERLRR